MPKRSRVFVWSSLVLAAVATAGNAASEDPTPHSFPLRIVELGGHLDDPAVLKHVKFSIEAGFNALWVPAHRAGGWIAKQNPEGPHLNPEFLRLAEWCAQRDVRLFVALRPERGSDDLFVYGDERNRDNLRKFSLMLHRDAGVRDVVLDFRGAPRRLVDLGNALRYGAVSARAHVDLAAWLRRKLRRRSRLWLAPAVDNDAALESDPDGYASRLIESLPALDSKIGIVWAGPLERNVSVSSAEVAATRARFGGRRLLLRDNFLVNGYDDRMALSLLLSPLRGRDPGIAGEADGYVVAPMRQLGASRLSLLTVADYLKDPRSYDPDAGWKQAMRQLCGDDPRALEALKTQGLEWGGWIGGLNYKTAREDNPAQAAANLRDPAAVAAWRWSAARYPARMADLSGVRDTVFRDDLLDTMRRRLSVARAVPLVVKLRSRNNALPSIKQLQSERRRVADQPGAREALDRFLAAAGVLGILLEAPGR